jgi:hypothetical protein
VDGWHCGERHHDAPLFTIRFIIIVASDDAAGTAGGGDKVHDDNLLRD